MNKKIDKKQKSSEDNPEPQFEVGLLDDRDYDLGWTYWLNVEKPEGWPLSRCYRFLPEGHPHYYADQINIHILAAQGQFEQPLVPVTIPSRYQSLPWAQLPTVEKIELEVGRLIQQDSPFLSELMCVESLVLTAHTSDGKVFRSPVNMAVRLASYVEPETAKPDDPVDVYVTPEAQNRVNSSLLFDLMGSVYAREEPDDKLERAGEEFEDDLEQFWQHLIDPHEPLRNSMLKSLAVLKDRWERVSINRHGVLTIRFRDGKTKRLKPSSQPARQVAQYQAA